MIPFQGVILDESVKKAKAGESTVGWVLAPTRMNWENPWSFGLDADGPETNETETSENAPTRKRNPVISRDEDFPAGQRGQTG